MTNRQAAQLRSEIDDLARQLDAERNPAAIRNLKLAIRDRELRLTEAA